MGVEMGIGATAVGSWSLPEEVDDVPLSSSPHGSRRLRDPRCDVHSRSLPATAGPAPMSAHEYNPGCACEWCDAIRACLAEPDYPKEA